MAISSWFTHAKLWFCIVIFVYERVLLQNFPNLYSLSVFSHHIGKLCISRQILIKECTKSAGFKAPHFFWCWFGGFLKWWVPLNHPCEWDLPVQAKHELGIHFRKPPDDQVAAFETSVFHSLISPSRPRWNILAPFSNSSMDKKPPAESWWDIGKRL